MSALDSYSASRIENETANAMAVRFHYLHRKPAPPLLACGLSAPDGTVVGFLTFGLPVSMTVRRGVCGPDEAAHVVELTRLWVDDAVPKNGESYFIGRALALLRTHLPDLDIVVSYADTAAGHRGVVYQATNFLYTGHSALIRDPVPVGFDGHRLSAGKTTVLRAWYRAHVGDPAGKTTFDFMEAKYGAGCVGWRVRSRKERYVMFNGNRRRNRELRRKLRWKVLPYPKSVCDAPAEVAR